MMPIPAPAPARALPMVLAFLAWLPVQDGQAAGLRDLKDAWLVGPDQVWQLMGPPEAPVSGTSEVGGLTLTASQGTLYSLPGLQQRALAARFQGGLGGRQLDMAACWQELGTGFFRETALRVELGMGRAPGLGLVLDQQGMTMGEWPGLSWLRVSLRFSWRLPLGAGSDLEVQVEEALTDDTGRQDGRQPWLRGRLLHGRMALALQIDRLVDGRPLVGGEVLVVGVQGVGLGLRFDPVTASLGPGLQVRRGRFLLRTSHVVHPVLGTTHRFSLTLVLGHD